MCLSHQIRFSNIFLKIGTYSHLYSLQLYVRIFKRAIFKTLRAHPLEKFVSKKYYVVLGDKMRCNYVSDSSYSWMLIKSSLSFVHGFRSDWLNHEKILCLVFVF